MKDKHMKSSTERLSVAPTGETGWSWLLPFTTATLTELVGGDEIWAEGVGKSGSFWLGEHPEVTCEVIQDTLTQLIKEKKKGGGLGEATKKG